MTTQSDWKSTQDWKNDVMVGVIVQIVSSDIDVEIMSRADDRTGSPQDYWYYVQLFRKWQEHATDGKFVERLKTDPEGLRKDMSIWRRGNAYALSWCLQRIQGDAEEQWECGKRAAELLGLDGDDPDVAAEVYVWLIDVMTSVRNRLESIESDEEV